MTRSFLSRSSVRRDAKAYTLIELVVGLALTMLLMFVGTAWVSTLMRASGTAVEQQSTSRDVEFVEVRFGEDLDAARPCRTDFGGWAFNELGASRLGVYADVVDSTGISGEDGVVDLVVWDVVDGALRRSVSAGIGPCTFATGTTATMLPLVIAADSAPFFTASDLDAGAVSSADCSAAGAQCDVAGVRLRLVALRTSLDAVPVDVDVTAHAARIGRWYR